MAKPDDNSLPATLVASNEFRDLTDHQKRNFSARLNYIVEVAEKIGAWIERREEPLRDFLDDLELDLWVNIGAPTDENTESSWLIHSSWTFGSSAALLREQLDPNATSLLDGAVPAGDCSPEELCGWLARCGAGLKSLLENFFTAPSYVKAIALLLAIDILLVQSLLGTTRARLNARIY